MLHWLVLLVSLLVPTAAAGGKLEASILVVQMEDGFGRDCPMPIAGFCLFTIREEGGPTNHSIDAYQRIEYAGIATDFSDLRSLFGEHWLLPDEELKVRGSDLFFPNPISPLLTTTWGGMEHPEGPVRLHMGEENFSLTMPRPSWGDPTAPWEGYETVFPYAEEGGVGYDQIGPFNRPTGTTTDEYLWQVPGLCKAEECQSVTATTKATYDESTPNVHFGLEFFEFEVATDPVALDSFNATGAQGDANHATRATWENEPVDVAEPDAPSDGVDEFGQDPHLSVPPGKPSPSPPPTRPIHLQSQLPQSPPPDRTLPLLITVAAATGAILAALGAALYSRFTNRTEALESEMRNRLLGIIQEQPGICLSDAAERLGVARNTVRHHLRVLERVQLVRVVQEGALSTFYPAGPVPAVKVPAWLRRNETCLAILREARARPEGLSREEVHRLLPEVPARTRNYNVARLLGVGALVEWAAPDGRKLLRAAEGAPGGAPASGGGSSPGAA